MDPSNLRRRARRVYELGRVQAALPRALWVLPLIWLAAKTCAGPPTALFNGVVLALVIVGFSWRGQQIGQAVLPGLLIGLVGFAVPFAALASGVCGQSPSPKLLVLCGLAGLASGAGLTLFGLRCGCCTVPWITSAALVAALTAAMACSAAGVGGVLGMALGLLVASSPAWWRAGDAYRAGS